MAGYKTPKKHHGMKASKERGYNVSMGQEMIEGERGSADKGEVEDYKLNKMIRRGHAEDSRFDEGSTNKPAKIVRQNRMGYDRGKFYDYLGKK